MNSRGDAWLKVDQPNSLLQHSGDHFPPSAQLEKQEEAQQRVKNEVDVKVKQKDPPCIFILKFSFLAFGVLPGKPPHYLGGSKTHKNICKEFNLE